MKVVTEHLVVPLPGETHCGDAALARTSIEASLLAVIDGLGHGRRAQDAARTAVQILEDAPLNAETTAADLIGRVHLGLRGTRGAAAMICVAKSGALDCCGVGNVELRAAGCAVPTILTPGVLGFRVRPLKSFHATVTRETRVAIFTDGLSSRFDMRTIQSMALVDACRFLIETHGRGYDDAAVLLGDFIS